MSQFVNSRDACGLSIAKLNSYAKAIPVDVPLSVIKAKLELLTNKWTKYEEYHGKILNVTGAKELDVQSTLGDQIEDLYVQTLALLIEAKDKATASQGEPSDNGQPKSVTELADRITQLMELEHRMAERAAQRASDLVDQEADRLDRIANNPNSTLPHRSDNDVAHINLPTIKLPNFQGMYSEWRQYKDIFTTLILNNVRLTNSQKLHYLKASVCGEAAQLLNAYSISDENFEIAWTALEKRFENKRSLTSTFLQKIVDAPSVKSESPVELRQLVDTIESSLSQLKVLDYPTDDWDALITFLIVRKLDGKTRRQWELNNDTSEYPSWSDLTSFLYNRCLSLEVLAEEHQVKYPRESRSHKPTRTAKVLTSNAQHECCSICKNNTYHTLNKCPEFIAWDIQKRRQFIRETNRCFNCLKAGHTRHNCRNRWRCAKCNKNHHTTLHEHPNHQLQPASPNQSTRSSLSTVPVPVVTADAEESTSQVTFSHAASVKYSAPKNVLLATAIIFIQAQNGVYERATALIDQGSQCSIITEAMAQKLYLKKHRTIVHISGVGSHESETAKNYVRFKFTSHTNMESKFDCTALIIRKITSHQPIASITTCDVACFQKLELADPSFLVSKQVDVLLGADVFSTLIKNDVIKNNVNGLVAQYTCLGWILSGPLSNATTCPQQLRSFHTTFNPDELNNSLRQFWELEEVSPMPPTLSDEDNLCEQHFTATHQRDITGRFIVKLPFKHSAPPLGSSLQYATSRLHQVEKRLAKSPDIKDLYTRFMDEYENLGHMVWMPKPDTNAEPHYYIPHHHVIKADSSTTKLRVVFDASRPTSTGTSLNDRMMTGPKLQKDIISILMQWRTYKYAFSADIEKMYRQILIHSCDQDYQRIVYRSSSEAPIKTYKLKTVTYGMCSAPYLAIRCLQQLAITEQPNYPQASSVVLNQFYVDDVMSGSDTIDDDLELQGQLIKLFSLGGFHLRKWSANHTSLLSSIPIEHQECRHLLDIQTDESVKALGLFWCPGSDEFHFKVNLNITSEEPTKRIMLSEIARFFDPVGWLAPVIIKMKIHLQALWIAGINWDDRLPENLSNEWLQLRDKLFDIHSIRIPRWIGFISDNPFELHGFCDASTKAYAAVIYARARVQDTMIVKLLVAKTRVSPVKTVSIPRLELCAAVLLTKLIKKLATELSHQPNQISAWTDSTIVLAWLKSHPCRWKCFVANRTTEILESLNSDQWRHISSTDNPADCASRGIYPLDLASHSLWWNGPEWLTLDHKFWPASRHDTGDETHLEMRSNIVRCCSSTVASPVDMQWDLIDKFSSIEKLIRVISQIIRFSQLTRRISSITGPITGEEIQNALTSIIRHTQQVTLSAEYEKLTTNQIIDGRLRNLNPFLDNYNVMRVGGRLQNSHLQFHQKHPIILSATNNLTYLLIQQAHRLTLHGGTTLVTHYLRQRYWILNSKRYVRQVINKCLTCFRHRITGRIQQMGQLPSDRVIPSSPFLNSGVDYAGPFNIKINPGRCTRTTKAYIAVFICMAVKAIHLEVVSDLTSEAFIAAFRRFTSRRGLVKTLYSDNGTNFVGARTILKNKYHKCIHSLPPDVASMLANDGTDWNFIPPYSPHFGGLWEAGVKSFKHHLIRVVKDRLLNFEELTTVVTQIEACLNSRPLYAATTDPDDTEVISPSHFLIGDSLIAVPEQNQVELKYHRRWNLVQLLQQHFWNQWVLDYLNRLQNRPKWHNEQQNLYVGQLVIVITDRLPPTKWLLGRVSQVHPGPDGLVRVVTVKCAQGEIKRPIKKLCPLPFQE